MRKIEKITLDELEETMMVIPKSSQLCFIGKDGYYQSFSNDSVMRDFLYAHYANAGAKEVYILFYKDGSSGVYIDSKNTNTTSYITLEIGFHGDYMYNGKYLESIAHSHEYHPNPTEPYGNDFGDYYGNYCGLNNYIYCYATDQFTFYDQCKYMNY